MYTEARKIHVIEEVLKINDDAVLMELEAVMERSKDKPAAKKEKRLSIYDFVGILSKKEAHDMKKAIEESCERIDADVWK